MKYAAKNLPETEYIPLGQKILFQRVAWIKEFSFCAYEGVLDASFLLFIEMYWQFKEHWSHKKGTENDHLPRSKSKSSSYQENN